MITFFLLAALGGLFIGIAQGVYETIRQPLKALPLDEKHLFYNSFEDNQKVLRSIQRYDFFQSLISNVAVVLLVAVLYWLCLSD